MVLYEFHLVTIGSPCLVQNPCINDDWEHIVSWSHCTTHAVGAGRVFRGAVGSMCRYARGGHRETLFVTWLR